MCVHTQTIKLETRLLEIVLRVFYLTPQSRLHGYFHPGDFEQDHSWVSLALLWTLRSRLFDSVFIKKLETSCKCEEKKPFSNTNRVLSPVLSSKRKERICCSILSYFPLKPVNIVFSVLLHQLIQTLYFVPIRLPPRQWSSSWRWVRESLFIPNISLCSVNKRWFFCLSSTVSLSYNACCGLSVAQMSMKWTHGAVVGVVLLPGCWNAVSARGAEAHHQPHLWWKEVYRAGPV